MAPAPRPPPPGLPTAATLAGRPPRPSRRAPAGEPVYGAEERRDIQGNIVPGFNKDHQHFLFSRFGDADRAAKRWPALDRPADHLDGRGARLRARAPCAAPAARRRSEPPLSATWVNIAFSFRGDRAARRRGRRGRLRRAELPPGPGRALDLPRRPDRSGDTRATGPLGRRRPEQRGRHPRHRRRRRRPRTSMTHGGCDQRRAATPGFDAALRAARRHPARQPARPRALRLQGRRLAAGRPRQGVDRAGRLHHAALPRPDRRPARRAFRQAGAAAGLAGPVPARRAAPAHRGSLSRRPPAATQLSRAGRRSAPTWCAGACGRTCRRSGSSPPRPQPRWASRGRRSRRCWSAAGRAARRSCARRPRTMPRSPATSWPTTTSSSTTTPAPSTLRADPGLRRRHLPAGGRPTCSAAVCPHFAHIRKINPRDIATDLGKPHDSCCG